MEKTPTLFLNGRRLEGYPGLPALRKLIDSEIERAESQKAPEGFFIPQHSPLMEILPDCLG